MILILMTGIFITNIILKDILISYVFYVSTKLLINLFDIELSKTEVHKNVKTLLSLNLDIR